MKIEEYMLEQEEKCVQRIKRSQEIHKEVQTNLKSGAFNISWWKYWKIRVYLWWNKPKYWKIEDPTIKYIMQMVCKHIEEPGLYRCPKCHAKVIDFTTYWK